LLYIPHGSDESGTGISVDRPVISLYIPHGSDERLGENKKEKFHTKLYIPHGSDERKSKSKLKFFSSSFISHMVQMKGPSLMFLTILNLSLYPTWFR